MAKQRKTKRIYNRGYEGYMKYYNDRYNQLARRGINIDYAPLTKSQFAYADAARRNEYKEMGKKAGNVIRDIVYRQTTVISQKQARAIKQMYQGIREINPDIPLPEKVPSVPDIMAGALNKDITFRDLIRKEYLKRVSQGGTKSNIWNDLLVELHYGGNSLYVK